MLVMACAPNTLKVTVVLVTGLPPAFWRVAVMKNGVLEIPTHGLVGDRVNSGKPTLIVTPSEAVELFALS